MKNKVFKHGLTVFLALVIAAAAFTAGFFTSKCTRSGNLSSIEWAIDIIEKNYYFGGENDGFSDSSIDGIVNDHLDRYSRYYSAEEYKALTDSNAGSKSGLGISYSYIDGKGVYVASVVGNSPAHKSGLRAGDVLKSGSVNGNTAEFKNDKSFKKFLDGIKDDEYFNLNSVYGQVYTTAKTRYTASYAYLCTNETAWCFRDSANGGLALYENPSESKAYLPDGAAYVALSQFYGSAATEFSVLVEKFNAMQCTSLILDLRSNGGGYVDLMQQIAGTFTDGKKEAAMYSRDKKNRREKYNCYPEEDPSCRISKDVKIYVLANSGTASASEALIGAMICYGVLEYKNIFLSDYSQEYLDWLRENEEEPKTRRTYGKGIMQSTFVNDKTGEALKLTVAKIFWPDGTTCIHDKGITVEDGCTPVKADWQHTKYDEELQKVSEIIKSS